jgi:anaerobic magnesium-protoporphyrin IX monomethyl ester cyclase
MYISNSKKEIVTIIIPSIIVHDNDPHTGIPFMPHMAAYLASSLKKKFFNVDIIDCLGINSSKVRRFNDFTLIGIDENEVLSRIKNNSKFIFIYCRTIEDLFSVEKILESIKKETNKKVFLFENIQTTNSFSLRKINKYLFDLGADGLIFGEPEITSIEVLKFLLNQRDDSIPDFAYKKNNGEIKINNNKFFNKELDKLNFPDWESFQLDGYWQLGFAHPPIKKNIKFLPIITSRGCPYRCKFCVSPTLNPTWRGRSAKNVVDEMEYFSKKMDIKDFHVSDLDPTVNDKRTKEICNEIINRKLDIEWKIAQGTKIETIKSYETLDLLKNSGLKFFSFSPESGSAKLMKKLNKPFDYKKGIKIVKYLNKLKIRTQACFIIGTPDEQFLDKIKSLIYCIKLTIKGVDEIAVFIYSPIPGSELADRITGYKHFSELTRTPKWRKDIFRLKIYRFTMYFSFLFTKLIFKPLKLIGNLQRIFNRNFETKMEMSVYKIFKLYQLYKKNKLWQKIS